MTRERKLWRWLPLLPVLALTEVFIIYFIFSSNRSPEVVGEFTLPVRGSRQPVQALYRVETTAQQIGWTPELLHLAGDLWREAGDITRALPYWQAAANSSAEPVLLRNIAHASVELQDWARAAEALESLATILPDDTWVHFQLGLIQVSSNPAAAVDHLTRAASENAYAPLAAQLVAVLRGNPDDPATIFNAGVILADHQLWPYAELAFTQVSTMQTIPEALAYTGFVRNRQGKDGSVWIEQAVELAPESATVRLLQGLHLRQAGDYAASLEALVYAVAADPQNPVLYAELGAAYQLAGDFGEAQYWLEQAVAISGNDARFRQMLDTLMMEEDRLLEMFTVETETSADATAEPIP